MKKYAFVVAVVFICTNAYAIDFPWSKPPQKKDAAADTAKPAAPAKAVVAKPVVPAAPVKAVAAAPVQPAKAAVVAPAAPANATQPAPVVAPQKKLTKEEMITRITEVLKSRPNLVSVVQGLVATPGEDGVTIYTYNGKKLADLDEDTLFKILSQINQQISLDNLQKLERQQRQLKNLQQIDQINKTQRMLQQQQALSKPAAPKVYTPPKVPRTHY
ncbi:MAG: hypothetical protein NTY76_05745 [Candidatus Omnitrophica bacterium]|nr:hypothetical protein [Candidatus Omnitrophota bacterium]